MSDWIKPSLFSVPLKFIWTTSMKRQFSISVKTSAAKFFVSLTFVLQFLLGKFTVLDISCILNYGPSWIIFPFMPGLSNQTEVHLSVFFHFNQRIRNRQTDSTVCIGPFSSDVSRNCGFDHHKNEMDCFKCCKLFLLKKFSLTRLKYDNKICVLF